MPAIVVWQNLNAFFILIKHFFKKQVKSLAALFIFALLSALNYFLSPCFPEADGFLLCCHLFYRTICGNEAYCTFRAQKVFSTYRYLLWTKETAHRHHLPKTLITSSMHNQNLIQLTYSVKDLNFAFKFSHIQTVSQKWLHIGGQSVLRYVITLIQNLVNSASTHKIGNSSALLSCLLFTHKLWNTPLYWQVSWATIILYVIKAASKTCCASAL